MSDETTPAVERAAHALLDVDHGEHADMYAPRYSSARAILTAALNDPDDPDWLARTLYVLAGEAENWTADQSLLVWDSTGDYGHVRARWRVVADSLRMVLTGRT